MAQNGYHKLSRRERQIMDILYQRSRATAAELETLMPDPPTNAAVRAKLRVLEEKGFITHVEEGPRFIYRPLLRREQARRTVLQHVVQTFFSGSVSQAVAALLQLRDGDLTEEEFDRLAEIIERHRVGES